MRSSAGKLLIIVAAALAFSAGAVSQTPSRNSQRAVPDSGLAALVEGPQKASVREGIAALEAGKYEDAARAFNRAVAQTPNVSGLHVLTGMAYHLAGSQGKPALLDLAETGYGLAAELDPTNYFAQMQLGRLYLETRRYTLAQQAFARVLDIEHDSGDAAYGLAVASYYARDLNSAVSAIRLTERLRPEDASVQRASALIWSSVGIPDKAGEARIKYAGLEADTERLKLLDRRMNQWREVVQSPALQVAQLFGAPQGPGTQARQATPPGAPPAQPGSNQVAPHWADCVLNGQQLEANLSADLLNDLAPSPALPSPCVGRHAPRMVMLDMTYIRTEEEVDAARGNNLLEGLNLVLGYTRMSTTNSGGNAVNSVVTNRNIGLPQAGITYSLNIANAAETRSDVLARPTLIALDRVPSQFFTGNNLTIAVPGQLSGGSIVEKPIGVSLTVTPTFIDDDTMLVTVKAGRSDVQVGASGTFQQSLRTARNAVTANVILHFGETLILSGMHESEVVTSKSGVPVLRDIPGLQYFFSNAVSAERRKSVLITLTPRRPPSGEQPAGETTAGGAPPDKLSEELRNRLNRDYNLPPNALAIARSLSDSRFVQQFRNGDLREDDWRTKRSFNNFVRSLLSFLYY